MPIEFREACSRGLRQEIGPRNAQQLRVADYLRVTDRGLVPHQTISNLLDELPAGMAWPFPQVFLGKDGQIILVGETATDAVIAGLTGSLTTYSLSDMTTEQAITIGGGPWHIVDYGATVLLFNEKNVLVRLGGLWYVATNRPATASVYTENASSWAFTTDSLGGDTLFGQGEGSPELLYWAQWGDDNSAATLAADRISPVLISGKLYKVTFEVLVVPPSETIPVPGAPVMTVSLGGTSGTPVSAAAEYVQYIRCGSGEDGANLVLGFEGLTGEAMAVSQIGLELVSPTIRTACDLGKGRMLWGGFANPYAFCDIPALAAGLMDYPSDVPTDILAAIAASTGPGQNWAAWSSAGGDDLLKWFSLDTLIYKSLSSGNNTGFTASNPFFLDLVVRNEFGEAPMPWGGTLDRMLPLGRSVIAYGKSAVDMGNGQLASGGAACLLPRGERFFGAERLVDFGENVGIAGRCAVGGDEDAHLLIDEGGEMWIVAPGERPVAKRFGHKEFFTPMLENEIVVSYEQHLSEFVIADGERAYVFNKNGLSRAPWIPTSLFFSGAPMGVLYDHVGTALYDEAAVLPSSIKTEEFSPGGRSVPQIETVEIEGVNELVNGLGWGTRVAFKRKTSGDWEFSDRFEFDGRGVANPKASGVVFYLVLSHPDRKKCSLENIIVTLSDGQRRRLTQWQSTV